MNIFEKSTLEELINQKKELAVSIYLPTHRAGQEVRQDPIRFKNLLRKAEDQLKARGMKERDIKIFLNQAAELVEDHFFWVHQSDGLALFVSANNFIHYRLPYSFDELSVVTHGFYLKPLLPLLSNNGQFYILALDLKNLKFYQATRFSTSEIELPNLPASLDDALKYFDFEKQPQFHTEAPPASGNRQGMFHGQGVGSDEAHTKKYILQYFLKVNDAIRKYIVNQNLPILLVGLDHLVGIYREANSYPRILDVEVKKDPQSFKPKELHENAWEAVSGVFRKEEKAAMEKFNESLGKGLASKNIDDIVPAAFVGRVEYLFLEPNQQTLGLFDPSNHQVQLQAENDSQAVDLLDFSAIRTLLNDGTVYALSAEEMPESTSIAAVFRY
jgi:hypothetical protein